MSEIDFSFGVGIGVRGRAVLDTSDASSSASLYDTRPTSSPSNGTDLVTSARGVAPSSTVYVRTQEGGIVAGDPPATLVARDSTGGDWYGYDVQGVSNMAVIREVESGGTYIEADHPHAVSLTDGRIAQVSYVRLSVAPLGGGEYTLSCDVIGIDGATDTQSTVMDRTRAFTDAEKRPCLVVTESGRWLVYSWLVDAGDDTAQIQVHYSDDEGATWALGAESCLPTAVDVSATGYTLGRIRGAESGGAVVLMVERAAAAASVTTYRDEVVQYASRDFGLHFVVIATTDEDYTADAVKSAILPDVIKVPDGAFYAAWVASSDGFVYGRRLGSAFESFVNVAPTLMDESGARRSFASKKSTSLGNLSLALAGDSELYCLSANGFSSLLQLIVSADSGRNWNLIGKGSQLSLGSRNIATTWRGEASTLRPGAADLASLGGRLVIACIGTTGAYEESLRLIALGGPTNVTMPPLGASANRRNQSTWDHDWLPFDDPAAASTTTTVGTPAVVLDAEKMDLTTSGTAYGYYETTLSGVTTSLADSGVIVKAGVRAVSGGSLTAAEVGLGASVEDSAASYSVTVRITSASAQLYDEHGSTTVGSSVSLTAGTDYEYLLALADGTAQLWTRPREFAGWVQWTQAARGAVADGGTSASTIAVVRYGCIDSASAQSYWYHVSAVHDYLTGTQITDVYENPENLLGLPHSASGVTVGPTRAVLQSRGATIRGDVVELLEGSTFGLDRLSRGGPRRPCRLSTTSDNVLVYSTGSTARNETDVLVVAGFGCNVPHIKVEGYDGSSPTTLADAGLSVRVECSRAGDTISPASPDEDTPTLAYHELEGDYFAIEDTGSTFTARKIGGNREGHFSSSAGNPAHIFLEEEPASGMINGGTGLIIPRQWAVVIDLRGAQFSSYRITIPSPGTTHPGPPEGYWQIGELVVGHLTTSAYHPSWGNKVSEEYPTEIFDARDQQRDGIELGPIQRRFRLGFVDGVRQYRVINEDFEFSGDWFKVSTNASSEGMGQDGLVLHSLAGLIRRTKGGLSPVVYLPRVDQFTASRARVYNRREQVALVYIDSPVERSRIVGQDMHGTLIRGDLLEFTEAT